MSARASISVLNLQRKLRVNVRELDEFSARAFAHVVRLKARVGSVLIALENITVVLVSDRRMAAVHRRFLNEPGATDVITFQDGDIFVSVETAQRNARRFATTTHAEIRLYIVHGLLHLHGFDDRNASDARLMERAQKRIVEASGLN